MGLVESLSPQTVRLRLKKTRSSRGSRNCIRKVGAEFVAAMEDVLELYAEPYDPQRPVVCFDATSTQLLADVREPLRQSLGGRGVRTTNTSGEGRATCFTCEPRRGWRHVAITRQLHHAGLRSADAVAGG